MSEQTAKQQPSAPAPEPKAPTATPSPAAIKIPAAEPAPAGLAAPETPVRAIEKAPDPSKQEEIWQSILDDMGPRLYKIVNDKKCIMAGIVVAVDGGFARHSIRIKNIKTSGTEEEIRASESNFFTAISQCEKEMARIEVLMEKLRKQELAKIKSNEK